MSDFKDRMIETYERGWCSYEGSYDYVREQMADAADLARKREKEALRVFPPIGADPEADLEAEADDRDTGPEIDNLAEPQPKGERRER